MDDKQQARAEGGRRFQRKGPIMEKDIDMAMVVLVRGTKSSRVKVHYYLEALPTQHECCRSYMSKCHRQLRMKDLSKVPMWWPEWDSNPRPFGRKAMNLPMSHHTP